VPRAHRVPGEPSLWTIVGKKVFCFFFSKKKRFSSFPGTPAMTSQAHAPLTKGRDFVKVEITIGEDDVGLVRDVAAALSDPTRQSAVRTLIRQRLAASSEISLKALLACAPLEGIELERTSDAGRKVAL